MLPVISASPDKSKLEALMFPTTSTLPFKVLIVTEDIVLPSMLPVKSKV